LFSRLAYFSGAPVRAMKISTFNVNGRLPILLRSLESSRPDVVCLQELKAPQASSPRRR
jgi:exodeoxyribonuclease III